MSSYVAWHKAILHKVLLGMKEEVCTTSSKNAFSEKQIKTMQLADQGGYSWISELQLLIFELENPIYPEWTEISGQIRDMFNISYFKFSVSFSLSPPSFVMI